MIALPERPPFIAAFISSSRSLAAIFFFGFLGSTPWHPMHDACRIGWTSLAKSTFGSSAPAASDARRATPKKTATAKTGFFQSLTRHLLFRQIRRRRGRRSDGLPALFRRGRQRVHVLEEKHDLPYLRLRQRLAEGGHAGH